MPFHASQHGPAKPPPAHRAIRARPKGSCIQHRLGRLCPLLLPLSQLPSSTLGPPVLLPAAGVLTSPHLCSHMSSDLPVQPLHPFRKPLQVLLSRVLMSPASAGLPSLPRVTISGHHVVGRFLLFNFPIHLLCSPVLHCVALRVGSGVKHNRDVCVCEGPSLKAFELSHVSFNLK